MSLNTVCRICLAMDVPMYNIADSLLQNIYEKLTRVSLNMTYRPVVACFICCAQLRKSHNLMVRSLRADRVLAQLLLSDDIVKKESMAMLNQETYQYALHITPVELITITGTEHNLVKTEIKEEPLLSQYDEGMETDRPVSAECLTFEQSEEEDMQRDLPEDDHIESQGLIDSGDIKQEQEDPLNIFTPLKYIDTKEITDREDMQTEGGEGMTWRKPEGAAPAEKCKEIHEETIQDTLTTTIQGTLTPGGEKPRTCRPVVEEATSRDIGRPVRRSTKTANHRQFSINAPMSSDTGEVCVDSVVNTSSKQLRRMFVCDDCGSMFDDKYLLIEHIERHITVKKTRCRNSLPQRTILRKQRVSRTGVVNKHTETHSGDKLIKCEICQRRFTTNSKLNRHLLTHTCIKAFECEICKVRFSLKGNLQTHLRVHTKEKSYECEICKVRFSRKGSLKRHLRVHTKEKPYECKICKVRFSRKGHLQTHLRVHTKEKPHECEICKVRFSRNDSLKRHLRVHTKEKPYECEICKAKFSHKDSLKQHLRIHTKEKPYGCDICKFRCSRKGDLKKHLRVHTKEKPYECEICKVRFNQKGHLKKHLRVHTLEYSFTRRR